jgi:hypothetical protein
MVERGEITRKTGEYLVRYYITGKAVMDTIREMEEE